MTSGVWQARYPDLNGKVAVVTGTSSVLLEVACVMSENGVAPALVVDDRRLVDRASRHAQQQGVPVLGVVADPTVRSTWDRVTPHIEQRLGPIDIVVVIAPPAARAVVVTALVPDMAARRRGAIVEAGTDVEPLAVPDGVRHRAVSAVAGVLALDLAAVIALSASDVVRSPSASIRLA